MGIKERQDLHVLAGSIIFLGGIIGNAIIKITSFLFTETRRYFWMGRSKRLVRGKTDRLARSRSFLAKAERHKLFQLRPTL